MRTRTRIQSLLAPVILLGFAACDSADSPAGLTPNTPTAFSSPVGEPVAQLPSIRVEDENGRTLAGVEVRFVLTEGTGSIGGELVRTDAAGVAQLGSWTLGTLIGKNQVVATVNRSGVAPVAFDVMGVAGPPAGLEVATQPAALVRNDESLERQPEVRLLDQYGNQATQQGVIITASLAGGTSSGLPTEMAADGHRTPAADEAQNATAMTDAQGVARFQNLRVAGSMGDRSLRFSAEGLQPTQSEAFALVPGEPDRLHLLEGPPAELEAMRALNQPVIIQLQDRFLNDVPKEGVEVEVSVTGGRGTVENHISRTNEAGQAIFQNLVIRAGATGERRLGFSAPGLGGVEAPPVFVQGRWPVRVQLFPSSAPKSSIQLNGETLNTSDASGTVSVRDGEPVQIDLGEVTLSNDFSLSYWQWFVFDEEHPAFPGLANVTLNQAANAFVLHQGIVENGIPTGNIEGPSARGPLFLAVRYDPPDPTNIQRVQGDRTGDNQGIKAGESVTVRPTVRVTTASGAPAPGQLVRFSVSAGGGSITGAEQVTNENGEAAVGGWTMGNAGGLNALQVALPNFPNVPAEVFQLQAAAPTPSAMSIVPGTSGGSAQVGTSITPAPTVLVTGPGGVPIPGVTVQFTVMAGNGSVSNNGQDVTNAQGGAQVGWTMGTQPGTNTLQARIPSHPNIPPVTFTASATPASGGGDSGGGSGGGGSGGGGGTQPPPPPPPVTGGGPPAPVCTPGNAGWTGNTMPLRIIEGRPQPGAGAVAVTVEAQGMGSRTFCRSSPNSGITVNVPRGVNLRFIAHFVQTPGIGANGWGFSALKMKAMNAAWGFSPDQVNHGNAVVAPPAIPGQAGWELFTTNSSLIGGGGGQLPGMPTWQQTGWGGALKWYCGNVSGGAGVTPNFWYQDVPASINANTNIAFFVVWILDHGDGKGAPGPNC